MKKRNVVQGLLTGTLLLGLVGCGGEESTVLNINVNKEETTEEKVEVVTPENEDLVVETEQQAEQSESEEQEEKSEEAKDKIEDKSEEAEDKIEEIEVKTEEIADKGEEIQKIEPFSPSGNNTKDWQPTNLYVPDDDLMEFIVMEWKENVTSPQQLFALWEEACGVVTGAELLSFDGTTLDFSVEFEEFINKYGSSGEYMYINGLVSTFKEYETSTELYITIEGNIMVTGHSYYDFPL